MSRCADYLELISAYADGELAEPDRRRVEEHLEACEQCSAILDFYREISIASDEACVPAPGALCDGVMEKILSGGAGRDGGERARPRLLRTAVTKYLPVAACLAVMLISIPWIANNYRSQTFDMGAAPEAMVQQYTAADAPEAFQDSMAVMAGGGGPNTFSEEMPAPGSDAAAPDEDADVADSASGRASGEAFGETIDDAFIMATDGKSAPSEAEVAEPELSRTGVRMQTGDLPPDIPEPQDASLFDDYAVPRSTGDDADRPSASGVWDHLSGFQEAYAWIELTGGRPGLLQGHETRYLPAGLEFQEYYLVPQTVVADLIEEAARSDGIDLKVYPFNIDSDYAIILWKPH